MKLKTLELFEQTHGYEHRESFESEDIEGESEEESFGPPQSPQWLRNKSVLLRVDFNVPLDDNREVTDDTRIRAALPTIQWLKDRGATIVLLSHLGRPKGTNNPRFSMMPVAEKLQQLLEQTIYVCDVMDEPETLTRSLKPRDIVLLENLRFNSSEKLNDGRFAEKLALIGDYYVNDAFGLIHRKHASVHALAEIFAKQNKAFAGFLMEKETAALDLLLDKKSKNTNVTVLGGAKVSDKIILFASLARRSRNILIGGAMGYTFMKAKGIHVGSSKVENDKLSDARKILEECAKQKVNVHLPIDHICAPEFSKDTEFTLIDDQEIPEGMIGLDIGPKTRAHYAEIINAAGCVFWNGPMGVFEWEDTAEGTRAIATAMTICTGKEGYTVVGGGDSAAAVEQMGLAEQMSHISTGGGASLAYLENLGSDNTPSSKEAAHQREIPGLEFVTIAQ